MDARCISGDPKSRTSLAIRILDCDKSIRTMIREQEEEKEEEEEEEES